MQQYNITQDLPAYIETGDTIVLRTISFETNAIIVEKKNCKLYRVCFLSNHKNEV